ncbi:hypothetical protein [Chitinophaga sp. CF418]|uniref:hypothetical protein n=1 Tax=Chitinophaga sp. CF418 TaxID=1855287 RepID=UPI00091EF4A1|nr:hypothetical protein [Chitinophaga sp. CF418]SHN42194.1 hypothetical protein SAMN05216311_114124 [Chitinophaga sp. CF418]
MSVTEAKNMRMNIQMNIVHVLVMCANLIWASYTYAKRDSLVDQISDSLIRIESNQKQDAADAKIWRGKVEADLAELKVRTALLEARVFNTKR